MLIRKTYFIIILLHERILDDHQNVDIPEEFILSLFKLKARELSYSEAQKFSLTSNSVFSVTKVSLAVWNVSD